MQITSGAASRPMPRPTIICHMATSLDGRLLPERWPIPEEAVLALYDAAAEELDADGWIVGRETMQHYVPAKEPMTGTESGPRQDVVACHDSHPIALCFDRQGRLRPEAGDLDGDHLVLVLSERVSAAHVETLAARGVSVFFAGPDGEDIAGALDRIGAAFGVDRLLLEGGGRINGAFLDGGLIDEISTLVFPVVDGQDGVPAIFGHPKLAATRLGLMSTKTLKAGTVWLRHSVLRAETDTDSPTG